jgi:hypothetical protein
MSFMRCVWHKESGVRISGPGIPRTRPAVRSLRHRSSTTAITRRTIILLNVRPRAVMAVSPRISR